jgi:AcrR family transcriptional regulator
MAPRWPAARRTRRRRAALSPAHDHWRWRKVYAVVQARIEVQVRAHMRRVWLLREQDREHMQLIEARTELVLQLVGPADTLEPAARRAVRSAVLALPEHLGEPGGDRVCPTRVRVRQVKRWKRPLRLVLRRHWQIVRGARRRRAEPDRGRAARAIAGLLMSIGEDHTSTARVELGAVGNGEFSGHESLLSCTLASVPALSRVHAVPKLSIVPSEPAYGLCVDATRKAGRANALYKGCARFPDGWCTGSTNAGCEVRAR